MALLCEGCHSRVTRKFWSKQRVIDARENPWCIREGHCSDAFDINDNRVTVWVGTNKIVNISTIFEVDNVPLLSIEPPEKPGGPYRLSGEFYDENGNFLFRIARNEWFGEKTNWDIECVGGRIIIRTAVRQIALQILCDPPSGIVIERMNMSYGNTRFVADDRELRITAYDKSSVIICGREIIPKDDMSVVFSALSKGGFGDIGGGGSFTLGSARALRIGDGHGSFSMGAMPMPGDLPKTLRGKLIEANWGKIKFKVPPTPKHVGPNHPCICQSGRKSKKCCGARGC